MQNNGLVKTFFISFHQVLVKSRFKKFGKKINIINDRVSIQFILLQRQKMERHMISLIQSIKGTKGRPIFDDIPMQHHLVPGVLNVTGTTSQDFFTIHKQEHGFHIMQSSQKHQD